MDLLGALEASFFEELDDPSFLDVLFDSPDDFASEEAPSEEAPSEEEALAGDGSLDLRA